MAVAAGGAIGALACYLLVGGPGSFTTVATFSLDVLVPFERGAAGQAGVYVLASAGGYTREQIRDIRRRAAAVLFWRHNT